jgi:hypothetical protein
MVKSLFVKVIGILMVLILFGSCVMSTKMRVDVTDANGVPVNNANVFVNGQSAGQTPGASTKVSNFVVAKNEITVSKEGYYPARVQPEKQVKVANVLCGILLLNVFAWLWVYGPKAQQNVVLTPEPAKN